MSGCELSLGDIGSRLGGGSAICCSAGVRVVIASYLVGLMRGRRSDLALLTGSKFGKVTVVITLPVLLLALVWASEAMCAHILW